MTSSPSRSQGPHLHSIVIPVFNERHGLDLLHDRLISLVNSLAPDSIEIVLVNDGSSDGSEEILDSFVKTNPNFRAIHLSRNFGHQIAITAGLEACRGDTVSVIDADLQDPPELIKDMIDKWREGFDVIYGVRRSRSGETFMKLATARLFYRLMRSMTTIDIPLDTGDFRLMDRKVVDALIQMPEQHRFVRGMVSWVGFKHCRLPYDRSERASGSTHFTLRKMIRFAIDGITSFSITPLRAATILGFGAAGVAVLVFIWALYIKFFTTTAVQGWLSVIGALLFLGGAQLITLGVLGEYIGRIYNEVKRRPLYFVRRTSERDQGKESLQVQHE